MPSNVTVRVQADVNDAYGDFVRDVARGRGVSVAKVHADYGRGRLIGARQAVALGMADGIGTVADVLRSSGSRTARTTTVSAKVSKRRSPAVFHQRRALTPFL